MNPLNLLNRPLSWLVNRAIGMSEAEKDALVTPEAIAAMWAEAFPIVEDYADLDHLEKAGYLDGQRPDTPLES